MSTRAQRRANKRNAQQSTGPQTDAGKQRSSHNALKHGLLAKHPVIPGEDPVEYQHKLDRLRADIRPLNSLEDDLVEQIADASWRLKRIARIQAAVEREHIADAAANKKNVGKDAEQIIGYAFTTHGRLDNLTKLARYESQLSRRYHRAIKELTDLRKDMDKTHFQTRAMEERDQEEQHWRDQHPHSPPEKIQPQPATATSGGYEDHKSTKQSQSLLASLESMTQEEFDALDPNETLRLIEKEFDAMMPKPGQLGRREAK